MRIKTKRRIIILFLSIKYWLQGDSWLFAKQYADFIVNDWEEK